MQNPRRELWPGVSLLSMLLWIPAFVVAVLGKVGIRIGMHRGPLSGHPYRDIHPRQLWARHLLSWLFLRGSGLEIGALHMPLRLYHGARAKYVDLMGVEAARAHYPELSGLALVVPDFVESGEQLPSIPPESQDFIVANHFIEHCEDPIRTVVNLLERLRPGGLLFLTVPMRDHTFDEGRPLTTFEHLKQDFVRGAEHSRGDHYRDWARLVENTPEEGVEALARKLEQERYSIHFHVWSYASFRSFICQLKGELGLPLSLVASCKWRFAPFEAIYVLRRDAGRLIPGELA